MIRTRIATISVVAAMAFVPAQRAAADLGDALIGGAVGGIIGGVIVNQANKNRQQTYTRTAPTQQYYSADRKANIETQTALNYFGFPAGSPDGVMGGQSRSAISQYQAFLGYPATGELTEFQRNLLVTSYYRASAGGAVTEQQAAASPYGMRGLLLNYRAEMAGGGVQPQANGAQPTTGAMPMPAPAAPAPQPAVMASTTAPAGGTVLRGFSLEGGAPQASLASECSKVSLATNAKGGYTTVATMTDPNVALSEQFCLARTYAISQGEEVAAKVQGMTPDQINQQCAGFGPAMKSLIDDLATKPRDAVLPEVATFVQSTGIVPSQLASTAKICLSVGYRTDNMDVAIGSAMLMVSLGQKAYAELIGHHLSQGFGVTKRPDLARDWYMQGFEALSDANAKPLVPAQPDRANLILMASQQLK